MMYIRHAEALRQKIARWIMPVTDYKRITSISTLDLPHLAEGGKISVKSGLGSCGPGEANVSMMMNLLEGLTEGYEYVAVEGAYKNEVYDITRHHIPNSRKRLGEIAKLVNRPRREGGSDIACYTIDSETLTGTGVITDGIEKNLRIMAAVHPGIGNSCDVYVEVRNKTYTDLSVLTQLVGTHMIVQARTIHFYQERPEIFAHDKLLQRLKGEKV